MVELSTYFQPEYKGDEGIGGWLLIIAIRQFTTPLGSLYGGVRLMLLANALEAASRPPTVVSTIKQIATFDLVFTVYALVVLALFLRKQRLFKSFFVLEMIAALALSVTGPMLMGRLLGMSTLQYVETYMVSQIYPGIVSVAASAFSLVYVLTSSRVRKTFVRSFRLHYIPVG